MVSVRLFCRCSSICGADWASTIVGADSGLMKWSIVAKSADPRQSQRNSSTQIQYHTEHDTGCTQQASRSWRASGENYKTTRCLRVLALGARLQVKHVHTEFTVAHTWPLRTRQALSTTGTLLRARYVAMDQTQIGYNHLQSTLAVCKSISSSAASVDSTVIELVVHRQHSTAVAHPHHVQCTACSL